MAEMKKKYNFTDYFVRKTIRKLQNGELEREALFGLVPRGRPSSFDDKFMSIVERLIDNSGGNITIRELMIRAQFVYPKYISVKEITFRKFLKRNLLYIRKNGEDCVAKKYTVNNKARILYTCSRLALAEETGRPVIFIDETGTTGDKKSGKVLARTNEKKLVRKKIVPGDNTTCVFATGRDRMYATFYSKAAINSASWTSFLQQFVDAYTLENPGFGTNAYGRPLVIIDNLNVHKFPACKVSFPIGN
jgi:hypothetical protein